VPAGQDGFALAFQPEVHRELARVFFEYLETVTKLERFSPQAPVGGHKKVFCLKFILIYLVSFVCCEATLWLRWGFVIGSKSFSARRLSLENDLTEVGTTPRDMLVNHARRGASVVKDF
jgi:hypothetical protein